jgi:hypothetical protein
VIHAFAVGANLSDLADAEALRLLRSSNASLRRVATYHLAMVVWSDDEDEPLRNELRIAASSDPDPEVRWWAQFGLDSSGENGLGDALQEE